MRFKKGRSYGGRYSERDIVSYLMKENGYLREQLAKIIDINTNKSTITCTENPEKPKIIPAEINNAFATNNNSAANNTSAPEQSAPPVASSPVHDEIFIVPRRSASKQLNSWQPDIPLQNRFITLCDAIPFDTPDVSISAPPAPAPAIVNNRRSIPQKRPIVTTNERHLMNFKPIVPGNRSFAESARGPSILIIGDSLPNRIRKREFYSFIHDGHARFKCFPGANASKINYYLVPELIENKYNTVIIHTGTNDLHDKSVDDIVQEMSRIRETCLQYHVKRVVFSGIILRRLRDDVRYKRDIINTNIENLCNGLWQRDDRIISNFIYNDNILFTDLHTDGIHLSESGNVKLANNLLNCINNY